MKLWYVVYRVINFASMLLLWRLTVNLLLVWLDLSTCSYLIKLTMLIWFEPIGFFSITKQPPHPLYTSGQFWLLISFLFLTGSREKFYIVCHHITWGKYTECPFSIFLTPDLEFNRSCKVRVPVYLLAIFHNILSTITNRLRFKLVQT